MNLETESVALASMISLLRDDKGNGVGVVDTCSVVGAKVFVVGLDGSILDERISELECFVVSPWVDEVGGEVI